jgi:hypothetical protein
MSAIALDHPHLTLPRLDGRFPPEMLDEFYFYTLEFDGERDADGMFTYLVMASSSVTNREMAVGFLRSVERASKEQVAAHVGIPLEMLR